METQTITLPTIHRNGTAACDLLEDYCKCGSAIRDAIRTLENAGPNGRDYYPQGARATSQAMREREARIAKLAEVLAEIVTLQDHVADEGVR